MQESYTSPRLQLERINASDSTFILELLNTAGWIKFIGDRNVRTEEDAEKYIEKILANPAIVYWVVRSNETGDTLGMVSFIKRDYLDHHDIGFAFLPRFSRKGYAFEAAETVLRDLLTDPNHQTLLATVTPNNDSSQKLLKKLGFHFRKEIENENTQLLEYAITVA